MKLSKSKLDLAKVINENGGWPERALWAVQDSCIAFFRGGKPEYKSGDRCWYSNSIDGACVGTITCDEKVTNWHQCVLSREEYYRSYPNVDADGWIERIKSAQQVDVFSVVDVRFRDGGTAFGPAHVFDWSVNGGEDDIIAYRLHKPEVKPEFCESVTRSIPGSESIDELCAKVTEENKHQHVDVKPTIERLAQDYRNAKDYALRLQKEAGEAAVKAESFAVEIRKKILELQELIGIPNPEKEPELAIADWRDLQVNDVIFVGEHDGYESGEYVVVWLEDSDYDGDFAVIVVGIDGIERCMDTAMEWRFIRRS